MQKELPLLVGSGDRTDVPPYNISLRAVILHHQLELPPGSLSNSPPRLHEHLDPPDRLFHHLIPKLARLPLHLYLRTEGRVGEVLLGVVWITGKTPSIQRSIVGDGTDAIGPGPDVDNNFGCGSWALAPWQH